MVARQLEEMMGYTQKKYMVKSLKGSLVSMWTERSCVI